VKGRYAFDFVKHPERLQSPMMRERRWRADFLVAGAGNVAKKFSEVKARGGKFGVIGSNHTTNEENYFPAEVRAPGLGTNNIDHHRTGDWRRCSMRSRQERKAGDDRGDLYERKAVLVRRRRSGAAASRFCPSRRAPISGITRRTFIGHARAVREDNYAASVACGGEIAGVESLRDKLKAEPDLVIVFGDSIQGDELRKLVAFGDSLGIPVKYVCLVDYSNSRGAFDMGLAFQARPGRCGPIATACSPPARWGVILRY
jgi:NADH-quinone oxidoreductase subunit G